MTETPEARVTRLTRELAAAKVDALQQELAEATAAAFAPERPQGAAIDAPPRRSRAGWVGGNWLPAGGVAASPQRLAPAPRHVPWKYRAMLLPWSWWTVFTLFMVAVSPIALWAWIPLAAAGTAGLTFLVIVVLRGRRDRLQLSLLKWGDVADVISAEVVSVGTYYSGTTYQNVRLPQAHGWHVERRWYSGPSTSTKITYQVNNQQGVLGLHGLPYDNGVILAHPQHPDRALCVSAWAYDLDRDLDGNWTGKLPVRAVLGSVAMTLVLLTWTAGMVTLFTVQALDLPGLVRK
jgi:hypothetical protein